MLTLASNFAEFAAREARGESAVYERLALVRGLPGHWVANEAPYTLGLDGLPPWFARK